MSNPSDAGSVGLLTAVRLELDPASGPSVAVPAVAWHRARDGFIPEFAQGELKYTDSQHQLLDRVARALGTTPV
jgi:hypothetical protein